MPIECVLLANEPVPIKQCPACHHAPFEPFLRGEVQRSKYTWFGIWPFAKKRDYCALICWQCKTIVGYESPRHADS